MWEYLIDSYNRRAGPTVEDPDSTPHFKFPNPPTFFYALGPSFKHADCRRPQAKRMKRQERGGQVRVQTIICTSGTQHNALYM